MTSDISIVARDLGKRYYLYESPVDRIRETFHPLGKIYHRSFDAVRDVSFTIHKGESFGIIGRNGSGKSTLLQMICGILQPTFGSVEVRGRIAALLELGAGFNPEFTGRENVYLNGAILGLSVEEIDELYEDIVSFADIGEFVDRPVKTYSSGMYVRLAFAVQACVEPEILVVDEALSVGDVFFQQKCLGRMRVLREKGTTLVFVSHDMGIVRELCESAVYLRQGEMVFCGPSHKAAQLYFNEDNDSAEVLPEQDHTAVDTTVIKGAGGIIWKREPQDTAGDAIILNVTMEDEEGLPSMRAAIGETVTFSMWYRAVRPVALHASISIRNRFDNLVTCNGTYLNDLEPQALKADEVGRVSFSVRCDLEAGPYTLHFSLSAPGKLPNRAKMIDETPWLGPLEIQWDYENVKAPFLGMFALPVSCSFTVNSEAAEQGRFPGRRVLSHG